MANFRGIRPRIMWGAGYQKEVVLGYPLDSPVSYREPRQGSDWVQAPSGAEDGWVMGPDRCLEGDLRWIAPLRQINPQATGWNGGPGGEGDGLGFDDWLADARLKNVFRWHPDGRNLVLSPAMKADANADGVVDNFLSSKSASVTAAWTLDVPNLAQKIAVTVSSVNNTFAQVAQQIFGDFAPGDVVSIAGEYMTSALTGTAAGRVLIQAIANDGVTVLGTNIGGLGGAGAFTRFAFTNFVLPAGTVSLNIVLRFLCVTAGDTGNIWFRNVNLVRGAADLGVFVDNPYYLMYLVDPMQGPPTLERDLTRALHVKMRTSDGSAIAGY